MLVDGSKIGWPDKPPASELSMEYLEIVVLEIISPSTELDNTLSHKISKSSWFISGDILIKIGNLISFDFDLNSSIPLNSKPKFSIASRSLKPGVFGDEIFIVK